LRDSILLSEHEDGTVARRRIGQEDLRFAKSGVRRTGSLNEIANLVDWAEIDHHLAPIYASAKGEQAWPPLALFKALLLAVWHDLSDVKLAEALDDRASFRRFCGGRADPGAHHAWRLSCATSSSHSRMFRQKLLSETRSAWSFEKYGTHPAHILRNWSCKIRDRAEERALRRESEPEAQSQPTPTDEAIPEAPHEPLGTQVQFDFGF